MGTQIAAVRTALVEALAELPEYLAPGPTGQVPEVSFGWRMNWQAREKVWTQRARFTHEPASMRATKTFRTETGYFDLLLFVNGVGLSQQVATERVVELAVAAEDWIATHANWQAPNLIAPGVYEFLVVGDGQVAEGVSDGGAALAELTLPVRYKSQLT